MSTLLSLAMRMFILDSVIEDIDGELVGRDGVVDETAPCNELFLRCQVQLREYRALLAAGHPASPPAAATVELAAAATLDQGAA